MVHNFILDLGVMESRKTGHVKPYSLHILFSNSYVTGGFGIFEAREKFTLRLTIYKT